MTSLIFIAADLAAISILTFVLYLRRHRRRDLVVSYLGMNVGVLAVATALSGSAPPNCRSTRWPTTSRPWHWA